MSEQSTVDLSYSQTFVILDRLHWVAQYNEHLATDSGDHYQAGWWHGVKTWLRALQRRREPAPSPDEVAASLADWPGAWKALRHQLTEMLILQTEVSSLSVGRAMQLMDEVRKQYVDDPQEMILEEGRS